MSGSIVSASQLLAASGSNSLMWPGAIFHVVSGPDLLSSANVSVPDSESWGFRTYELEVTGNGTWGDFTVPTLGVYDSAIGIAMPNDDVVDAAVANSGHRMAVALWSPNDTGAGLILWARCGGFPTSSSFNRQEVTNAAGAAFFEIDPPVECSGQQVFISVTNTSDRARAFRLAVLTTRTDHIMTEVRVGVAWNATASQMNDIRQSFRQAAWQLFGLSGGNQLIRNYRYYHNAVACDDGHPADEYACSGFGCQVCLSPSAGRANYNSLGKTTLYAAPDGFVPPMGSTITGMLSSDPSFWGATDWMAGGDVIVHEFGHHYAALENEYTDLGPGDSRRTCNHSWMGEYDDNAFTFCTAATHRSTGLDWNNSRSHRGASNVAGLVTFFGAEPRPAWQEMWDDGEIAAQYPTYQTPEVLRLRPLWTHTAVGACLSGC